MDRWYKESLPEALWDAVGSASSEAMLVLDEHGVVRRWSAGATALLGYPPEIAEGHPLGDLLFDAAGREALRSHLRAALHGHRVDEWRATAQGADGAPLPLCFRLAPIDKGAGGALLAAHDPEPREAAERALNALQADEGNRAVLFQAANQVALDILARRTGVEALRHIADAARQLAGAQFAALGVAGSNNDLIEFVTVGLTNEEEARIGPRPRGAGVLGMLLRRTSPLRIPKLGGYPGSAGFPPNHPPMGSFLGVPIRRGDTVLGSLYLTNKQGADDFTEADEAAVEALGAHAAVAIHHLQMLSRQRALVSGLIAAQEEERRAVAYDLHDGLTQYVMAAHSHLESSKRATAAGKPERAEREMETGLRYLGEAVVESRRLVNGLRTLALDDLGLAGALEQLLNEEKARAGWSDASLVHNIAGRRFDKSLETAAYRVAQEALTNVRKHARAERVRLLLLREVDEAMNAPVLKLEVQDWGVGFPTDAAQNAGPGHVGLHSMVERVRLMDGKYELASAPGRGTLVRAVFPALEPGESGADRRDSVHE